MKNFKIKDFIFKNFALKILAVIIAVVLWIVIVNVDNPSQRKTITGVTVNLLNVETLTEKDYTYQVNSGSVISIVVKAPQSIVEDLKASDFNAYADLSERSADSDKVPIHVECTKSDVENQVDIVSLRTEFVQLAIDNRVDRNFNFTMDITGTPAEDYVIGDTSISPTTIKVSGAEKIVQQIESAVLRYNVEGMTDNIDDAVVPVFLDADGNEVNTDKLEISRSSIRLKIDILPTKWVPVNFAITGEPGAGYEMVNYSQNLDSVKVAASREQLASFGSIDISAGDIDITGLTENTSISVPLSSYLPGGYRIVSSDTTLQVDVKLERIDTVSIEIPVSDIAVTGMRDDFEYEITSGGRDSLTVELYGRESDINGITSNDLKMFADISGKSVGRYRIQIVIADNDRFTVNGTYYLDVLIRRIAEETTPETEPDTDSETEQKTTPEEAATVNAEVGTTEEIPVTSADETTEEEETSGRPEETNATNAEDEI